MSDIFISYAKEDREIARTIAEALEQRGWSVWWDPHIPPGKMFHEVIEEALEESKCVLVLWSKSSVRSRWVIKETNEGERRNILVPAMIDKIDSKDIPLAFRDIQAADLTDWKGDQSHLGFLSLVKAISGVVGVPSISKPAEEDKRQQAKEEAKRKAEEEQQRAEEAEKKKLEIPSGVKVSSRSYVPWLIGGAVIIILVGMFLFTQKIEKTPVTEESQHIENKVPKAEPIARKGRLYVKTDPSDARIRISNIKPVYTQGMELDAGEYHIEVSKNDYETQDKWVTLGANRDLEVTIELKPLAVSKQPQKEKLGKTWKEPVSGIEFVRIPGGCYEMGDNFGDGQGDEVPIHPVCLDDFYIGKYEVMQKQWQKVMGNNPSHFKGCDDCPVEKVNWNDVQDFIKNLNNRTGKRFRLPTEAEWEYAARSGGKKEKWAGTNSESEFENYAWYSDNSKFKTHPVGQRSPNGLELYDMSGNMWEWVNDRYDEKYYSKSPEKNPKGPTEGTYRVLRGGSWVGGAGLTRSSNRLWYGPTVRSNGNGFRLALSPK